MCISTKQIEVVSQLLHDGIISTSSPSFIDEATASALNGICDKYRKTGMSGMFVVTGELTANGGNIHIYGVKELQSNKETSLTYGDFNSERCILIEPKDYPRVEPFNRQTKHFLKN